MDSHISSIITSCQSSIDSAILANSSNPLSYEELIIPHANKILTELNNTKPSKWPLHRVINGIDIYVEAISIHMLYSYNNNIKFDYPLHCIVNVLLKHPYYLNIIQSNRNISEYIEYVKLILNEITTMYGDTTSTPAINSLKNLLIASMEDKLYSNASSLHKFHYLTQFTYESNTTGITGSELLKVLMSNSDIQFNSSTIFIAINISYNLANLNSIVIYRDINKYREKLLNIDTIKTFTPFIYPSTITTAKTPYSIYDSNLVCLQSIPDNFETAIILLSYNDATDPLQSHYSLAKYKNTYCIDKKHVLAFLDFKSFQIIDSHSFENYLIEEYYKEASSSKPPISELKSTYTSLLSLVKQIYLKSTPITFTTNFIDALSKESLINSRELPYLKIYLSKIKTLEPFTLPQVSSYVLSYIYPELLTTTSDL